MSGQCTGWILRSGPRPDDVDREGRPYGARARGMRAVLLTIGDSANSKGENAHPGLDSMIEGSLYERRQVLRLVDVLVDEGWVRIRERARRGYATVFDVMMDRRGDTMSPQPDADGVTSSTQWGDMATPDGVTSDADGVTSPLTNQGTTVLTTSRTTSVSTGRDDDLVETLCSMLADQIERHRDGVRPKITKRWHRDMDLLMRRGALHVEPAVGVPVEKIMATIKTVFTHLAVPDPKSGFCWADQVRSPAALRDHWAQMAEAYKRKTTTSVGRGAQAVDRVANRLMGNEARPPSREPLGLLPPAARST